MIGKRFHKQRNHNHDANSWCIFKKTVPLHRNSELSRFNLSFLLDMEKMTVCDLQCKLYIETLREKFQNRDFMFTTFGEERIKNITKQIGISDSVDAKILEDFIPECKDKDFYLALLFSCWKEKQPTGKSKDVYFVNSYILQDLKLDFDKIINDVVLDCYTPYLIHKEEIGMFFGETDKVICGYDHWDGRDTLEIDTDFFSDSTKVMSEEFDYLVSMVIRDLKGSSSKVLHFGENCHNEDGDKYSTVIARVSSCKDLSEKGIETFLEMLLGYSKDHVILIDNMENFLGSKEMYSFRKKIIDENLLDIYIGDYFSHTYILHSSSQSENSRINFVCKHSHSSSIRDNFVKLNFALTKSDVQSIDYDFRVSPELLTGNSGRGYSFRELFTKPQSGVCESKVSGVYPVFQMKDFPQGFSDAVKCSTDLAQIEVSGLFKVITENKIVFFIGDDKVRTCYIKASSEHPVYVGYQYAVLDFKTDVMKPEYVQLLAARGIFEKVFGDNGLPRSYCRQTDFLFDPQIGEYTLTPEDKVGFLESVIQIPSIETQNKEIVDAQFINAPSVDRERALEMLLAEKTWLNEEHIRNIKHRIGNELLPVKNDVDALYKILQKHPEGITLDTVRGKDEKISDLISRLSRCVSKVSDSLQDLTRTVDKGDLKPIDIVASVRDFVKDYVGCKNFKLLTNLPKEKIDINGSSNMVNSILRNIVDNAVRHGFVDETVDDYAVEITISKDGNGNCVLSVKNNGVPMSDMARENYFKRGSVAGATGHSGIGGADVKDTANAMGGEATLPQDEDGWSVCVRISLPILNSEKI